MFIMAKIPQTADHSQDSGSGLCTRVHGAGDCPNPLNRFVLSNTHKVLFVT